MGSAICPRLRRAPLLGGASLLVDQDGDAGDLAQLALHGVHFLARMDGDADRQVRRRKLRGIVRHQRDARHTFSTDAMRDGMDTDGAVDRLAAGHGDGVVEQDLVGDVGLGGDRLPDRHRAGVIVGAFAEILEDVPVAGESRRRCPVHALAAHLDQRRRLAVHPARHEVATDAGQRLRALRYLCRRVVWAARAEIRRTCRTADVDRAGGFRHQGGRARGEIEARKHRIEPAGEHASQRTRRQFADPGDQPRASLVMLADHALGLGAGIVVEILLELALDDAALFLDNEDLALALHEVHRVMQRQRPDHADLVDVDADAAAGRLIEAHQPQRFHQVEMRLACGDDAVGGVRNVVDVAVDRIGLCKGVDGVLLRLQPLLDLRSRQVRPAIVQAARRRREVGRAEGARRAQRDGCA
ncbi:hypothetical protein ACVJGC_005280 [Bradyrhizobium diazoefficiens]